MAANPHRVVIVGAGFGGLEATHRLAGAPVEITLIDRRNHHLFQPLLYQVATASLATSEIAWPVRHLMRDRREVTTLFATVNGVDADRRCVLIDDGSEVPYDTLVLATGARHAYFGHDEWEQFAPGLKTLEDATTLRRHILVAFERAERETDPARRAARLTFVIVGAGPTGVELAGTIAEMAHQTLPEDFRNIDTTKARVVLIEAGPRVLAGFADDLSAYAQASLEKIGVEVVLGQAVTEIDRDGVVYRRQAAECENHDLGRRRARLTCRRMAGRAGRSRRARAGGGRSDHPRPSRDLRDRRYRFDQRLGGQAGARHRTGRQATGPPRRRDHQGAPAWSRATGPFRYKHAGSLAQIGKRLAVIDFGSIKLRGTIAWWIWGIAHIYFLIGLRHRLSVALSWLWIYARDQRAARLITQGSSKVV